MSLIDLHLEIVLFCFGIEHLSAQSLDVFTFDPILD